MRKSVIAHVVQCNEKGRVGRNPSDASARAGCVDTVSFAETRQMPEINRLLREIKKETNGRRMTP